MIKDCPFCFSECMFDGSEYVIKCSKCTYQSGTEKSYEALVHSHNHVFPVPHYAELAQFIRYAPHHYDCAVEKWRAEFTKDSGPIPDCTCGKESLREILV